MSMMASQAEDQPLVSSGGYSFGGRWFRSLWLTAAIVTAVLVLMTATGTAKSGETRIAALSLAAIPEGASVEVQLPNEGPPDDLGISIKLANHIAILLAERGYRPVDGVGELIVRFIAEEPTYAFRDDMRKNGLERVNFRPEIRLSGGNPDRLRLRISVSRAARPPLWTGVIERVAKGGERSEVYLTMVSALMKHWGQTYDGR